MATIEFSPPPGDKAKLEEGAAFTPRFDSAGLVTAVVTDAEDGVLLMVAHMNAEALALTLETGIAHYWSRSRNSLWRKGETSGNMQTVGGDRATCHTGRRSCFYRDVALSDGEAILVPDGSKPLFSPHDVYGKS